MLANYAEAEAGGEEMAKADGEVTAMGDSAARVVSEVHMYCRRRSGKCSHL
mgnify:CR=1 FL=1